MFFCQALGIEALNFTFYSAHWEKNLNGCCAQCAICEAMLLIKYNTALYSILTN